MVIYTETVLKASFDLNEGILGLRTDCTMVKWTQVMNKLIHLSELCGVPLRIAMKNKMEHNQKKYPPKLCRDSTRMEKYTEYIKVTGITKEENAKVPVVLKHELYEPASKMPTFDMEEVQKEVTIFAQDRWYDEQYNKTMVISCTIVELGEFNQIIQMEPPNTKIEDLKYETRNKLAAELADVFIFMIHFRRLHVVNMVINHLENEDFDAEF